MDTPHKMLILGDMRELGEDSLTEHRKIIEYINEGGFEQVWLVGDQFAAIGHKYRLFKNTQELIHELQSSGKPEGKMILIKGSNGIKLSSIVDYL